MVLSVGVCDGVRNGCKLLEKISASVSLCSMLCLTHAKRTALFALLAKRRTGQCDVYLFNATAQGLWDFGKKSSQRKRL